MAAASLLSLHPHLYFSIHGLRSSSSSAFTVFSSHSNARILKPSLRSSSSTRRRKPPFNEHDTDNDEEEEEAEASRFDDEYYVEDSDRKSSKLYSSENKRTGSRILLEKGKIHRRTNSRNVLHGSDNVDNRVVSNNIDSRGLHHSLNCPSYAVPASQKNNEKLRDGNFTKSMFQSLVDELDFDDKWFPLVEYLSSYGLKESDFASIYERHMPCLQINLASARERLDLLLNVGVKQRDIKRILMRQPQILEYTVDNLKSHVNFLVNIGVPSSRIGRIITAAPSLLSYSVENSLNPTIRYLIEEIGIKEKDISKVVQLSPQILVQRIDNSWNIRFSFLSRELEAPKDSIVKMVTKHPQLLHYSIEDGILPRINFLRSIGMRNSDILKVLTNLTQVLSLSLEGNLKPKYLYLVNELRNEVKSLTKYPMYLSLSLEQRIRPRHKFLVSLKKAPKGPFPLSSLVPTDECFCQQWAGTSLESYLAFRQTLQLTDFAKKYQRR